MYGSFRNPTTKEKVDLAAPFVAVGKFVIQYGAVFGCDATTQTKILEELGSVPGVLIDIQHTGVREGYGHGKETIRLLNTDGSLILEAVRVDHCDGPGYSCSYSHGPWFTYGHYSGSAVPDPELVEALAIKERLSKRFSF
jgi:hypothetical protein